MNNDERLTFIVEFAATPQSLRTTARCRSMEHLNPPDNLPVVPDENEPTEDVPFQDPKPEDTLDVSPAVPVDETRPAAPASRSLQPILTSMSNYHERPIRAPDDLLDVDEVAEALRLSPSTIYRLARRRHLP